MTSADLADLVAVSRAIGANAGYVQGGGGNTSLKINPAKMTIKASGVSLAAVSLEAGFLTVDHDFVQREIPSCQDEDAYSRLLGASISSGQLTDRRPSIETGFHALLGRAVLHTHSVWANLLTCSQEGPELVRSILPDALWVDYATPGLSLTKEIANSLQGGQTELIFLQNHGIIVSADTPNEALERHEEVTQRIQSHFGRCLDFPAEAVEDSKANRLIFPDQAVYLCDPALGASKAGIETQQAVDFLMMNIPHLGLTLNFLDEAEKSTLINLESEKYRQKIAKA